MSAIDYAWNMLKMGVSLPDDAEGPFDHPDDPDLHVYESPTRTFTIPKKIGKFPENPEDPYHGFGVQPWWDEGGKYPGYHPHASESMPKLVETGDPDEGGELLEAGDWEEHLLDHEPIDWDNPSSHEQAMIQALGLDKPEDKPKTQMQQQLESPGLVDDKVEIAPGGMTARDMFKLSGADLNSILEMAQAEVARRQEKRSSKKKKKK